MAFAVVVVGDFTWMLTVTQSFIAVAAVEDRSWLQRHLGYRIEGNGHFEFGFLPKVSSPPPA